MARRRRRRRRGDGDTILAGIAGLGAVALIAVVVNAARAHPFIATAVVVVLLAVAATALHLRQRNLRVLAEHERHVAVTDDMTGTQFEHFTARLMRASGFRGVRVIGGSGDMGADVVARTPDGRRVVVQCKRFAGNLGSPHVQRFAGTAREIHRADVALLVTTGSPTAQAREVALLCRITLIDRRSLGRWLTTRTLDC
ncbi:restriction endonuclease [Actinoplanes sp. NPDC051851]|uniref:restriction endonuclease n=1 Tax=Actinoplanes sp. NPDC051851 TaxID=3154753 RepID=UPI0034240620